jgi:hypothetical protein
MRNELGVRQEERL